MIDITLEELLKPLQKRLKKPEDLLRKVSTSLAEEALGLIKDGYRTQADPYGDPWAPKRQPDGRMTLSGETSRLKTGWHPRRLDESGFTLAPAVTYAIYHQDPQTWPGTNKLKRPRRLQVPVAARGLPPYWAEQIKSAALEAVQALYAQSAKARGTRATRASRRGTKRAKDSREE